MSNYICVQAVRVMATNPTQVEPLDDTGSNTLARYIYQAHVAVPICIECASGGSVKSVVMEHLEDIAVETESGWRFLQIKTRNAERGPWKLRHVLEEGALKSLLRVFQVLGEGDYSLELHIEGAIVKNDNLQGLLSKDHPKRGDCQSAIAKKLDLVEPQLSFFMERLSVATLPARELIEAKNLSVLGVHAPALTPPELKDIHDSLVEALRIAMTGTQTMHEYPGSVVDPASVPDELQASVAAKRLSRERLAELVGPLSHHSSSLIERIAAPNGSYPSELERKLLAGGAPETIVQSAISLRANATIKRTEILAAGGLDEVVASAQEVLRIRAESAAATHAEDSKPAVSIFAGLLETFTAYAAEIDPDSVFDRKPELLLGEVCDLADRCIIDWGKAIA